MKYILQKFIYILNISINNYNICVNFIKKKKKDLNENYFTLKDLAFCLTELDYPYTKQEID